MNQGKYVFAQVLSFVSRYEFDKCVERYKGDFRCRELNCWNQFVQLLFGQITSLNSLRDICLCLKVHRNKLYHLGIKQCVNQSTLSRANEKRDWQIFADFGESLIRVVQPMYSGEKLPKIYADNLVYALDSTTISTSIKLLTWALGKYSRGAVKMHTLLNLQGNIPSFIHITHGKYHDSNVLDIIEFEPFAIYVMDRAYVDFEALYRIECDGAFFITRAKDNMLYEVVDSNYNIDPSVGLRSDQTIALLGVKSSKHYPKHLRRVEFWDSENDVLLAFITNSFELSALNIARLYQHRWQIEVFFYDKHIVMISERESTSEYQTDMRLLLRSTSHNNSYLFRSFNQFRKFLLRSHDFSELLLGVSFAYAFSNASRLAFESARA